MSSPLGSLALGSAALAGLPNGREASVNQGADRGRPFEEFSRDACSGRQAGSPGQKAESRPSHSSEDQRSDASSRGERTKPGTSRGPRKKNGSATEDETAPEPPVAGPWPWVITPPPPETAPVQRGTGSTPVALDMTTGGDNAALLPIIPPSAHAASGDEAANTDPNQDEIAKSDPKEDAATELTAQLDPADSGKPIPAEANMQLLSRAVRLTPREPKTPEPPQPAEPEFKSLRQLADAGTPVAQQPADVSFTAQKDEFAANLVEVTGLAKEFAGLVEQELPGRSERGHDERSTGSPSATVLPFETSLRPEPSVAQDSAATAPAEPAARLAPAILEQSVQLRHTSKESLEVVLRAEGGTQLHLQLTQRAGQIEATVRCEKGDTQALGSGWQQLQESLSQHGIRLAPLADASMSSDLSGRQQGSFQREQPNPEPFRFQPEPAVPSPRFQSKSATPAPAPRDGHSSRRVLESWA